jgi:anti-anti-sigma factor
VAVRGALDLASAPRLAAAISDVLQTRPETLIVDLCDVQFLDSMSLSVLLNARRRTIRLGIELKLACAVDSTLRLLALTKLENDFDLYPTREAALAAA